MSKGKVRTLSLSVALLGPVCAPSQDRPAGTNRLYHESSPYLQLHANNPVDWYPWGNEAIELARSLDRPIFLSIGYSTCYWCHRMEEDVFENAEIAAMMNEKFINIKVDREERPDLDEIYMTATQLMTRRGGWPNSVFLTPKLEPFFAGTYFPPEDRGRSIGFKTILTRIDELWSTEREAVEESAGRIKTAVEDTIANASAPSESVPDASGVELALSSLRDSFDAEWGGFGQAPKFPSPANLFLLHARAVEGSTDASRMLVETLHRMSEGALYDHVGGGFHRYATDQKWRVPHFEKMLYDNAFLSEILIDTAILTGDAELARYARGSLDFVLEHMTLPDGGFKSAIDAQTNGREGAFYVWSREELESVLGEGELAFIGSIFGFDEEPNFEDHEYTVFLSDSIPDHAARLGLTRDEVLERVRPSLEKLRAARQKREFPLVDDKVLADWNGMMIGAMAKGAEFFGDSRYRDAAIRAADFVLSELGGGDRILRHAWRKGESKVDAFVDDYAFMMRGLITLHRTTHEARWLQAAEKLAGELELRLRDPAGGYYQTTQDPLNLVQSKGVMDGAIPSGNGAVVEALLNLAELTGKRTYASRAESAMRAFAADYTQHPSATKTLGVAIARYHREKSDRSAAAAPEFVSLASLAEEVVDATISRAEDGFRLVLRIRDGWHVNQNPASSPYLIPTELSGDVSDVRYPQGELLEFSFTDEAIAVYGSGVVFEGTLSGDQVTLTYQACDDSRCLSPVDKVLRVPAP